MQFTIKSILVLCSLLIFASAAEAQIFKKLKNKAQQKLEDKVEQKVDAEMEKAADRMVEDSWNSVFGDIDATGDSGQSNPFTLSSNVTTEDVYNFDVVATMKITARDGNGKSEPPMFMDMHFRENAQYTGTAFRGEQLDQKQGNLFIIYDLKNEAMVMIMENEDQKFSYAYNWKQAMVSDGTQTEPVEVEQEVNWDEVEEWKQYKKIGQKTIAGYSCDGYRSENDQQVVEIWVSRETDFGMQSLFMANANAKQLKGKLPDDYPHGMLMSMSSKNIETGDETLMEVTNIDSNKNINYVMAEYPNLSLAKK